MNDRKIDLIETRIAREEKFRGRIFRITDDDIVLADGTAAKRELVHHPGGVCCAAINDAGEVAFVRQYRYAFSAVLTELPAGKLEPGEDPFDAIKREVSEEVGAVCSDWRSLGVIYPTPGYCTEQIHLYTCRICDTGSQHLDPDERIEVIYIPLDEAIGMAARGEFPDAKTQVILLRLAAGKAINAGG